MFNYAPILHMEYGERMSPDGRVSGPEVDVFRSPYLLRNKAQKDSHA